MTCTVVVTANAILYPASLTKFHQNRLACMQPDYAPYLIPQRIDRICIRSLVLAHLSSVGLGELADDNALLSLDGSHRHEAITRCSLT